MRRYLLSGREHRGQKLEQEARVFFTLSKKSGSTVNNTDRAQTVNRSASTRAEELTVTDTIYHNKSLKAIVGELLLVASKLQHKSVQLEGNEAVGEL